MALPNMTWVGPLRFEDDGIAWFEYRITELPDFFLACETLEELEREQIPALLCFLESFVCEVTGHA